MLNLLYPPTCLSCGELLYPDAQVPLCSACRKEWEKLTDLPCVQCKRPQRTCRCLPPLLRRSECEGLHLVPYKQESVAGRLLLIEKDERLPMLTAFFADEMIGALDEGLFDLRAENAIITYLPRSRDRANVTGVDPAKSLAKALAERLDLPMVTLFDRRNAPPQKELSAEERLASARRTYRLKKRIPDLSGRTVVLVDDILTSGATMRAGIELLRPQGAGSILCLSVGKTYDEESYVKKSGKT